VEEAQHVKSDTLEIARLAAGMRDAELDGAFEQLGSLGQLIDATLAGQASQEVETLHAVTGRTLPAAEAATLREVLHRSLSAIIVGVALGHPSFARVARDVSPTAAARLLGS
jgi:hypothetical protein